MILAVSRIVQVQNESNETIKAIREAYDIRDSTFEP